MTSAPRLSRVSIFAAAAALAVPGAALAQGKTMAQDDWVQTSAINWGGGVRVATGDVKGGAAAAGDEHEVEYTVVAGQAPPPRDPGALASAPARPSAREIDQSSPRLAQFKIQRNAPGPCRVGAKYPSLRLADGSGRWVLTGVTVVACEGGGMTVSYGGRASR